MPKDQVTAAAVDYVAANHARYTDCAADFQRIFNRPLRDCWDVYVGFDILKFDELMGQPKVSLRDHVLAKYGEEALALCQRLLGQPAEDPA